MRIPKAIERVIESFEKLPGIGPKTAQRLSFYLLHVPQSQLDNFSESLTNLKSGTVVCQICFNIGENETCGVCSDTTRDKSIICVVEDALDVIAIEKSGKYKGIYHVLHGLIDPLNSIGPNDIYIPQLLQRVKGEGERVKEIIIATNPTMEGEATSMYILREVKSQNAKFKSEDTAIKISRIGHGLPIGADLEYADEVTISRALEGRREY